MFLITDFDLPTREGGRFRGVGYSFIWPLRARAPDRVWFSGVFVLNGVSITSGFVLNGASLHGNHTVSSSI